MRLHTLLGYLTMGAETKHTNLELAALPRHEEWNAMAVWWKGGQREPRSTCSDGLWCWMGYRL